MFNKSQKIGLPLTMMDWYQIICMLLILYKFNFGHLGYSVTKY